MISFWIPPPAALVMNTSSFGLSSSPMASVLDLYFLLFFRNCLIASDYFVVLLKATSNSLLCFIASLTYDLMNLLSLSVFAFCVFSFCTSLFYPSRIWSRPSASLWNHLIYDCSRVMLSSLLSWPAASTALSLRYMSSFFTLVMWPS